MVVAFPLNFFFIFNQPLFKSLIHLLLCVVVLLTYQ
jgi:hypothetical protein